jgi:hypothetical protein
MLSRSVAAAKQKPVNIPTVITDARTNPDTKTLIFFKGFSSWFLDLEDDSPLKNKPVSSNRSNAIITSFPNMAAARYDDRAKRRRD